MDFTTITFSCLSRWSNWQDKQILMHCFSLQLRNTTKLSCKICKYINYCNGMMNTLLHLHCNFHCYNSCKTSTLEDLLHFVNNFGQHGDFTVFHEVLCTAKCFSCGRQLYSSLVRNSFFKECRVHFEYWCSHFTAITKICKHLLLLRPNVYTRIEHFWTSPVSFNSQMTFDKKFSTWTRNRAYVLHHRSTQDSVHLNQLLSTEVC